VRTLLTFLLGISSGSYADDELAVENGLIEIVEWGDVPDYWIVDWGKVPRAFEKAKRSKGGCVAISFIIESDGNTSLHKIVGSFPDDALDEVIIEQIRRTSFKPTTSNMDKKPVFTVLATGMWSVLNGKDNKQLREKVQEICLRKADAYLTQLVQTLVE